MIRWALMAWLVATISDLEAKVEEYKKKAAAEAKGKDA